MLYQDLYPVYKHMENQLFYYMQDVAIYTSCKGTNDLYITRTVSVFVCLSVGLYMSHYRPQFWTNRHET